MQVFVMINSVGKVVNAGVIDKGMCDDGFIWNPRTW